MLCTHQSRFSVPQGHKACRCLSSSKWQQGNQANLSSSSIPAMHRSDGVPHASVGVPTSVKCGSPCRRAACCCTSRANCNCAGTTAAPANSRNQSRLQQRPEHKMLHSDTRHMHRASKNAIVTSERTRTHSPRVSRRSQTPQPLKPTPFIAGPAQAKSHPAS